MAPRKSSGKPGSGSKSGRRRKKPGARSYEDPVPAADSVLGALSNAGGPLGFAALARHFDLKDDKLRKRLKKQLNKMIAGGLLIKNRRDEYCLIEKLDAISGTVSAHRDGFGFLVPDSGADDIFLPPHAMQQLMDGDRVAVRLAGADRKGRPKGELVEILERGKATAVGQFYSERGLNYVVETSGAKQRYVVAKRDTAGAKSGEMVKLEIVAWPTRRSEAQGKVTARLGLPEDPGMLTTVAIESFGLRTEWPKSVVKLAKRHGTEVSAADKTDRVDLRDVPLVTIDGADARDFDDAVFAERAGAGWRLIVAIADVSHYVQQDDALDIEAQKRGTSAYFPDRVVPMLPESLSNGLCSLNPHVDRLCMVCEMRVAATGKVSRSKFYRGVMRSAARLTYSQVNAAVVERDTAVRDELQDVLPQLQQLHDLYKAFAKARSRRGALDLELPEVRIALAEDKHTVASVAPVVRNDAHRLIEECMIAANVQAAKYLRRAKVPTLYRVHPQPELDRFEELRLLLQELGFKVPAEARTQPRALNKILHELSARPDYAVLGMSVLRTLSQALYQPGNEGHFGLALDAYAHFTSPIRRYPDLLVHRGIGHLLDGGKPGASGYSSSDMEQLGKSSSLREREAEAASRYVESRFKCIYLKDHVGNQYTGVVTGITHFGLFVMLDDLYVEGLIHVTNLGQDYFHVEHGGLRMRGESTGQTFELGAAVRVEVANVNIEDARVDLQLISEAAAAAPVRRPQRGRRKRAKRKGR